MDRFVAMHFFAINLLPKHILWCLIDEKNVLSRGKRGKDDGPKKDILAHFLVIFSGLRSPMSLRCRWLLIRWFERQDHINLMTGHDGKVCFHSVSTRVYYGLHMVISAGTEAAMSGTMNGYL